jgi:hypothetical protein
MREQDWNVSAGATLGMLLAPTPDDENDMTKRPALLALYNRNAAAAAFRLPPGTWRQCCDSSADEPFCERMHERVCAVPGHSVVLLAQD